MLIFAGKHAFVTGGTSGIGHAIAHALEAAGSAVTVSGLTAFEVRQFAETFPDIPAVQLDVTDDQSVARVVAGFTQLDILVNCAGMILRGGAELEISGFTDVVDVNLTGTMRVCAACRPLLARTRGRIVNTASMLSFFGSGKVPAYSASKGGIVQLTKSLAIAWAPDEIRVNAIAPGWIVTALTKPLLENEQSRQAIIERTPLRRWGRPEDVAGAVVFLCSPAAEFITGVVLPIDGGYSIA